METLRSYLQPKSLFILVLALYSLFGSLHLSQFVTADEHYWVQERIPQYWKAISEKHFTRTFINDKPGVSLALVSSISYFIHPESPLLCQEKENKTIDCESKESQRIYRDFRLPILIVNGLLLILLFLLITRVTDAWVALTTVTLTALSPILLGGSQILNPDSLLWSFGSIGIFSFLAFLKTRLYRYAGVAAVATGFALLSKYVALVLLLIYGFFTFADALIREQGTLSRRKDISLLLMPLGVTIGSLSVLCFFLPALVLNDKYLNLFLDTIPHKSLFLTIGLVPIILLLFDNVFFKNFLFEKLQIICRRYASFLRLIPTTFLLLLIGVLSLRMFLPQWEIFTQIPFDIKDFENSRYYGITLGYAEMFFLEWVPILFSLTPITVIGTFVFFLFAIRKDSTSDTQFIASTFPIIITLYLVIFLAVGLLVTPRYSILLYPLFAFLAALGISHIADHFKIISLIRPLLFLVVLGASLMSLTSIKPFYFNYANFLLPKEALISDSWGYGGYEAAEYLNALPNASELTTWSDYYGVCEFFVGKCLTAYTFDGTQIQPDYYVLTRRGKIRYMSRYDRWEQKSGLTAYRYYDRPNPDWSLEIDDRPGNYVKVFRVER
ncbi:MAG: glycosyltransferase family 39 protein [Candidatus Moraniibacteriota bacterium]